MQSVSPDDPVTRGRSCGSGCSEGETDAGGSGRPDGHRTQRGIVRMCRFVLCVLYAGTRWKFHAPPQIKPEGTERKSGKKCKRVDVGTVHKDTVYASKAK